MPHKFHGVRRAAVAAATTAAPAVGRTTLAVALTTGVLGVAASAADASVPPLDTRPVPPVTLQYECKYPLVDIQPLDVEITTNIPREAALNAQQPAFEVVAKASAGGDTAEAITTLDAASIRGTVGAVASLSYPSGFIQGNLKVPLTIDRWTAPNPLVSPLEFVARGKTPPVVLDEYGPVDIRVDSIALNLTAYYADGKPIDVKKLRTDIDGNAVTDSDGNPETFDVYCRLKDPSASKIATVNVRDDNVVYPPSTVTGLRLDSAGVDSISLSWTPSTDPEAGERVTYKIFRNDQQVGTSSTHTFKDVGLAPNTSYKYTVVATDGKVDAPASAAYVATTLSIVEPGEPPTVPGEGNYDPLNDRGDTWLVVRWGASTDEGCGLKGYVIEFEGEEGPEEVFVPAGTLSKRFDGLGPDSTYVFYISAVDNCGNRSEPREELLVTSSVPVDEPPSAPSGLRVSASTATSATLVWGQSTDDSGALVSYNVICDGVKRNVAPLLKPIFEIGGLAANTVYSCVVEAVDDQGQTTKSEPISFTTASEQPKTLAYGLKGSTTLKTLTSGKLPLSGGIVAEPNFAAGTFSADLTLNNTNGRLIAAGFLPITAKVGFVPVGKTTGTLDESTAEKPAGITTNSRVRIKVLEVKLFGSIPLAGGNNCQTRTPSDITLKSTNKFDVYKGGTIAGTYKISDLNGCGALNGLVSPLTAGGGNTITLDLSYKG